MKKILALLMVAVMAFAFCACDKKGGTNSASVSVVGEWESEKISYNGETLTGEDAAGFVFEFKADGTGECFIYGESAGAITWVQTGNSIKVTDEINDSVEGKLQGGKLVFDNFFDQGIDVTFAKN